MPRARPTCIKSSRLLSITAESWRRAHYHFTRAALFAVLDGSWLDSGHTFALLLLSLVRTQRAGRCATQACSAPPRRRALPLCGRDHRANTRLPHANTRRFISGGSLLLTVVSWRLAVCVHTIDSTPACQQVVGVRCRISIRPVCPGAVAMQRCSGCCRAPPLATLTAGAHYLFDEHRPHAQRAGCAER
jgi:hypothetical protein